MAAYNASDVGNNSATKYRNRPASNDDFWSNFWYALTHPISGLFGAIKAEGAGYDMSSDNPASWSAKEVSDYFYTGHVPDWYTEAEEGNKTVTVSPSGTSAVNPGTSNTIPTYVGQGVGTSGENTINNNGTAATNSAESVQENIDHFIDRYIDLYNQQRDYENAIARQNTEEARQWEEYMSSTSHQREVQDLEAAGLNKWLSANSGGASTPAVSAAATSRVGSSDAVNSAASMASVVQNMSGSIIGLLGKVLSKLL